MTVSFFQALSRLQGVLSQSLAGLTAQESAVALRDLSRHPEFRALASLESLATPEQLVGLLFHQDRYETVARQLALPPETLRTVFGAETRASRLLPARTGPHLRAHREALTQIEASFASAARLTTEDWKGSKVRRIAPRGREPIQVWNTNRATLLGSTRLVIEASAEIREDPETVERFAAQFRVKITDWDGAYLARKDIAGFLQNHLPGLEYARLGSFESRYEGLIPETNHGWQAILTGRNLAIIFHSPVFSRRQSEELSNFFSYANRAALHVLSDLLIVSNF